MTKKSLLSLVAAGALAMLATKAPSQQPAQAPQSPLSQTDQGFITQPGGDFVITNVELIDGTGTAPRRGMAVLVSNGRITAVGRTAAVRYASNVRVIDGTGKTLVPGFVMVHEHFFYPSSGDGYFTDPDGFMRLYLAGGATTIRTGGSMNPFADLAAARAVRAGRALGPDIDATGPYLEGQPPAIASMPSIDGPAGMERTVDYWAAEGATSFKLYENADRAELDAAVRRAHARNLRVTGHICATS